MYFHKPASTTPQISPARSSVLPKVSDSAQLALNKICANLSIMLEQALPQLGCSAVEYTQTALSIPPSASGDTAALTPKQQQSPEQLYFLFSFGSTRQEGILCIDRHLCNTPEQRIDAASAHASPPKMAHILLQVWASELGIPAAERPTRPTAVSPAICKRALHQDTHSTCFTFSLGGMRQTNTGSAKVYAPQRVFGQYTQQWRRRALLAPNLPHLATDSSERALAALSYSVELRCGGLSLSSRDLLDCLHNKTVLPLGDFGSPGMLSVLINGQPVFRGKLGKAGSHGLECELSPLHPVATHKMEGA